MWWEAVVSSPPSTDHSPELRGCCVSQILNKPDKALGILRTAVKRDRSNPRLYLHILDVCYQRHPVDIR